MQAALVSHLLPSVSVLHPLPELQPVPPLHGGRQRTDTLALLRGLPDDLPV